MIVDRDAGAAISAHEELDGGWQRRDHVRAPWHAALPY